jgi:multidrug efflux pump subunit AcrB
MLLFAGYRIAIIVGVLVPSAVLMAFVFMPFVGVQLEMMSIAALIISLGLLVDNAVVVSEQILVRLSEGYDKDTATSDATAGLMFPLLAASFTTIVAFLPIKLAPGGPGEFCYSLFAVVSLTLISSWVLSLTIIPLLCHGFLKPLKHDTYIGQGLNRLYGPYENFLKWMIGKRWLYPSLIVVATILAMGGMSAVPNIFFPPNERGQFLIDLELPLGTDIEETNEQVRKLEQWLLTEHPDTIRNVSSWIGNGGPRWYMSLASEPANPNYALVNILTHSDKPADIENLMNAVLTETEESFPSARITPKPLETGPPVGDPIQILLSGNDMKELYRLRERIVQEVKQVSGMYDIRDNWGAWTKQITVEPDSIRSSRLNLSTSDIASSLNGHYQGKRI